MTRSGPAPRLPEEFERLLPASLGRTNLLRHLSEASFGVDRRLGFLVRIEAKLFELSAPFRMGIAQALDIDAAG
jgi:hypothetical protein